MDGVSPVSFYSRGRIGGQQILDGRRKGQNILSCPVCKMSLRQIDLEPHLLSEVEQLMVMSRLRRSQQLRDEPSTSSRESPSSNNNKKDSCGQEAAMDSRWETYHRVRANRHSRLRLKTRRRREESGGPHVTCPVCQVPLQGSNEQFSAHVETCLRKNGDMMDEDEPVDIEGDGDGQPEEYTWLRNRRSRASPTGYCPTAINMTTNSRRREEDGDNLEVVVDGDDNISTYGHSQYSETDIQSSLRVTTGSQINNSEGSTASHDVKLHWGEEELSNEDLSTQSEGNVNSGAVIQALKSRVRDLENKLKSGLPHDGNHCLICMDKYRKPVVSISCWHVHCEDCWLRTLGTKKLCPQCNMITGPGDLRRIFL